RDPASAHSRHATGGPAGGLGFGTGGGNRSVSGGRMLSVDEEHEPRTEDGVSLGPISSMNNTLQAVDMTNTM
ncbi:unnamed protein product, partial [Amoebophrya sp. A25]